MDPVSTKTVLLQDFIANSIGWVAPEPAKYSWFKPPTPLSRPRRLLMDPQDRLYFGEYQGNKIGMLDTKTEKFTEWSLPTPWTGPYYVTWDKNGELWTGGMTTNRAVRLNPKTCEEVEYLMTKDTNILPA